MARHHAGTDKALNARLVRQAVTQGHILDTVDIKILSTLQADGRISNVNLSKKAGISAPPALRRTATLEERGIIKGYHAELDPKKFGFDVTAFIMVSLSSQSQGEVAAFEIAMSGYDQVRECHALSGHKDFLLRCAFATLSDSNDFVRDVLLKTPNVRTVNTTFAISRIKHEPLVPLEQMEVKLSLGDVKKLREQSQERRAK
jgi:DNA-binding Lrp family transcriptional regulator